MHSTTSPNHHFAPAMGCAIPKQHLPFKFIFSVNRFKQASQILAPFTPAQPGTPRFSDLFIRLDLSHNDDDEQAEKDLYRIASDQVSFRVPGCFAQKPKLALLFFT